MSVVCPALLAKDKPEFEMQLAKVEPFAKRIQIDLTDQIFTRTKTIHIDDVHWPKAMKADLHLMYRQPTRFMRSIVKLRPHMVIVHAESEGDFLTFAKILSKLHIKVGVALLPGTNAQAIKAALAHIDHVMIFSGDLGKFGGTADLGLLSKAQTLKDWKPSLEIGWDGGVNDHNAHLLSAGGVDVLNVGGFIQKASDPAAAYATLKAQIN